MDENEFNPQLFVPQGFGLVFEVLQFSLITFNLRNHSPLVTLCGLFEHLNLYFFVQTDSNIASSLVTLGEFDLFRATQLLTTWDWSLGQTALF